MRVDLAVFAALSLLIAPIAAAQDNTPGESDIVVPGVRPEEVQTYVEQITAVPPSINQIPRWNDDICISVGGLSPESGQAFVDRLSYRAQTVGLTAGGEGCSPNVFVFFAADASTFAQRMVSERSSLFAYLHEEHIETRGRAALTDFVETPRVVRWWHVTQTRGADGDRLGSDNASNNSPPPPRPGEFIPGADAISGAQAVRSTGSRIRAAERQDFNRVVVIVDGRRAAEYPAGAVADYIALVTLAQIEPDADTSTYPTILNLFAPDLIEIPGEMTNWDQAYLAGLYRSTRNSASASQQVREIARRMTEN